MLFKTFCLSVVFCLVAAQEYVPPYEDCGCSGYQVAATNCKWTDKTCSVTANSGFVNYQYWCDLVNRFRRNKNDNSTEATYIRYLPCSISNLDRETVDAQRANLILDPLPKYLVATPTQNSATIVPFSTAPLTTTKKWAQSPVKNQGSCGSCWAFAVTAFTEAHFLKTSTTVLDLSEQRVVSCDNKNNACNGGSIYKALDFYNLNGSVPEASFPYANYNNTVVPVCPAVGTATVTKLPAVYIEQYLSTTSTSGGPQCGNCTRLKQLLTRGSVVVSIHVESGIYGYKTGIFEGLTCNNTGWANNHAVLVTGYIKDYTVNGTTADVFEVKNSWGSNWGTAGFIYVKETANTCGLCSWFAYV